VVFVVDDLLAWMIGLVADAGRRKLVTLVLGTDQERALRKAVEAAAGATAPQLTPSGEQADQLAMAAVGKVRANGRRSGRGTGLAAMGAELENMSASSPVPF
jgi:hypothetical protein